MIHSSFDGSVKNDGKTNKIVESNLFDHSLFKFNPDMVIFLNMNGNIVHINHGFVKALGYTLQEIILTPFERFFPSSEIAHYQKLFTQATAGEVLCAHMTLLQKNGETCSVSLNMIPARFHDQIMGIFVTAKDNTNLIKTEKKLAECELKFSSIVDEALTGVYIVNEDGKVTYGNKAFYNLLGIENHRSTINFRDYVHPEDIPHLNDVSNSLTHAEKGLTHSFRMHRKDGAVIYVESHAQIITLQHKPHIVGTLQDITERKKIEELHEYFADHDYLTELPNKRLFLKRMEQTLAQNKHSHQLFAIMMLDIDRFKHINDSLGPSIGDQLLKKISERIQSHLEEQDTLSRIGGDEFAIIFPNTENTEQVINRAKKLIELLEKPFYIKTYEIYISTSIGISIHPNDGEDAETLLKNASSALNKAKKLGKNTYQIFNASMNTETFKLFSLESDLRKALELNQLELYYQPRVNATHHQIIGAEALIRWNHPDWGEVLPDDFIPIAGKTSLISQIEKWIMKQVCLQNKSWQDAGLPAIPISINISPQRFMDKDFVMNIKNVFELTKLEPEYFQIEILETSLLENENIVIRVLQELKEMGIRILLDDFGTGYSSLLSLRQCKGIIDEIKIDRSFIYELSHSDEENSNFITKTIIDLAHHLQMDVVAEGVETIEQQEILQGFKCNTIQGYLYSEPVPASEFAELLIKGKIEPASEKKETKIKTERRKYFRVTFPYPLVADMTLTKIHGRNVKLGKSEVLVENIGLGGLRFLSNLRLPVHQDIILEFETEILGNTITLYGSVAWMKELKHQIYQYGLEFSIDENERTNLAKLLNKLSILLRKNPLVPDCRFVKGNRYTFFKQKTDY